MRILPLTAADLAARPTAGPAESVGALTLGVFDGLHLGHRRLIDQLLAQGSDQGAAVVTFTAHPQSILAGRTPARLLAPRQRNQLLERWGVSLLVELATSRRLLTMAAAEFAAAMAGRLAARVIVVGPAFRFGRGRDGDLALLAAAAGARPVEVAPAELDGEIISATLVRERLAAGDLAAAAQLLGRRCAVLGSPAAGDRIGRTLGSPTVNLVPPPETLPDGVYAVMTPDGAAVAHIGPRPTFDRPERRFEVHLLDRPPAPRPSWEIEFVARLREVRSYPSAEALKEAIAEDIAAARRLLARGAPA